MPIAKRLLLLLGAMVMAGACGAGDAGDSEVAVDSAGSCSRFLVLDDPDWALKEAVDYPEDLGPLAEVEPGLDWYSELERFVPAADGQAIEGLHLRLSGYSVDLPTFEGDRGGIELAERVDAAGRTVHVGQWPDGGLSVVTWAVDDGYTIAVYGQGLPVEELMPVAVRTRSVCEDEWVAAGGRILD